MVYTNSPGTTSKSKKNIISGSHFACISCYCLIFIERFTIQVFSKNFRDRAFFSRVVWLECYQYDVQLLSSSPKRECNQSLLSEKEAPLKIFPFCFSIWGLIYNYFYFFCYFRNYCSIFNQSLLWYFLFTNSDRFYINFISHYYWSDYLILFTKNRQKYKNFRD